MDGRGDDSRGLVKEAIKLLMLALAAPQEPPKAKRRPSGPSVLVIPLGAPEDEDPEGS